MTTYGLNITYDRPIQILDTLETSGVEKIYDLVLASFGLNTNDQSNII